ncbi:hypothetical protein NUW58_g9849 [Xylaria curta]|uniref:Uncharacterized protein n=1 Tax=Xylaria curta TaxID=42375 RepID=A0ACC1MTE1_9PEZI|nr:hypothetical protein NUW58_g9849 [Xylaria curta]
MGVKTRFLIISDTHAGSFSANRDLKPDVLIHCGGLTDGSKIAEYRRILRLLQGVDAPLTLVIAGNHDFTLDTSTFRRMVQETPEPLDPHLVIKEYGRYGQAKALFDKTDRINLLNEGTYSFNLSNVHFSAILDPGTISPSGKMST